MVTSSNFWRGKKVFVTGHTGFKGSWLALWLQSLGSDVVGYALPANTNPSLFALANVGKGMESLYGDIRDLDDLTRALREHQPQIVFHLAAQSLVRYSYEQPVETYATNVMGTVNILEAVRLVGGVRAVLCVTSDKCYENLEVSRPYRESDPMGGFDPYSSSKGCDELVISAYRRSFFESTIPSHPSVSLASARAGNVIGGGDWSRDRLVVDVVKALLANEAASIRNPKAVRPWQHVLEPLWGYLSLVERLYIDGGTYATAWNFGPDVDGSKPVSWIADRLVDLWGQGARWEKDSAHQPHEANLLMLDASKAERSLGWTSRLDLEQTLEWVVEWYRAFAAGGDMRDLTLAQIARYESLLKI